jgi:sec-independent protein translocase protein TatA
MFGPIGGPELFLILIIALIVFGPRKLPEVGKSMGKMLVEFRRASTDFKRTIEGEIEAEKLQTQAPAPAPPPATEARTPAAPAPSADAASAAAAASADAAPPAPSNQPIEPE